MHKSILFAFLSLVPTPAVFAHAPELIRSARSGPWSAPDTWVGGKVPGTGARVQIRSGHAVTYDLTSAEVLRSIHVAGILTFSRDKDTRLVVGLIKIQAGENASEDGFNCDAHLKEPDPKEPKPALEVGTPNAPIPAERTAVIELAFVEGLDTETCPAIICCGGRLDIHGAPLPRTWVKLGATAKAGAQELQLAEAALRWRVGDRLLITTTDSRELLNARVSLRPQGKGTNQPRQLAAHTEERVITALQGERLTLDKPLEFTHRGRGDWRGEVANLSRNVVITSADPAKARGHTMYHRHSAGAISYAEFRHLGKEGLLGKYPIHYHLCGETMRGSYVQGVSVWDSGNRWITIHGTHYLVVRDCVGYQSVGHGYFLEDGTEVFNVFERNLAVQAFTGKPLPDQVLPFDHNDGAGFWWANSQNTFTGNVAVECDRYGFRFEATGAPNFDLRLPILQADGRTERIDIRTLPFIRFEGNEAHDQLLGINLGGLGGDFFKGGISGVVPDLGHPFLLKDTRIWNTHWAFTAYTRYAIDNLDIADSTYGLFLPAYNPETSRRRLRPDTEDEEADFGRLTFRRTDLPVFLPAVGQSYTGEPFDLMEFTGDTLPPCTVITHVRRTAQGGLHVRGTASDDGRIRSVLVNGQPAKPLTSNFAQWEITLENIQRGEMTLKALAIDEAANVEPRPHQLQILVTDQSDIAVSILYSIPAKRAETQMAASPGPWVSLQGNEQMLYGTWEVVAQQRAGRPRECPRGMQWTISEEGIGLVASKGAQGVPANKKPLQKKENTDVLPRKTKLTGKGLAMSYRLDTSVSPAQIEIRGPKKSLSYGILKMEGDTLTLCLGLTQPLPGNGPQAPSPASRPTAFSPEAGTVVVLRRVKK
jgi:uncharacterized protein (TIGR03067 family)